MARVSIRNVARAAKVAPSTVSLYMRGLAGVADDTGERIAAAMTRLGYTPKIRRPKEPRGGRMALVIEQAALSAFSEAFYGEIIEGLEAAARQVEIDVLLRVVPPDSTAVDLKLDQLCGAAILGESPAGRRVAADLAAKQLPLVLVDHYYWDLPAHAVTPDHRGGGYQAMQHLIQLGHRQLAIIGGAPKYHTLTDRVEGASRALQDAGIKLPARYRPPYLSGGQPRKGYLEMQRLLALPQPPSAVFAVSDKTAAGAMQAVAEAGLQIPRDLSLVGFDDVAVTEPALTTIRVSKRHLGRIAMQRLIQMVKHGVGTPTRTNVSTELVVRQSTAPVAAP